LAECIAFFTSSAGGFSIAQSLATAGAVSCALAAVLLLPLTMRAWHSGKHSDSTSERWISIAIPVANISVVLMSALVTVVENGLFPLIGGFSTQLLIGLWEFARLLTRPN
jgi:hypothetical protein